MKSCRQPVFYFCVLVNRKGGENLKINIQTNEMS